MLGAPGVGLQLPQYLYPSQLYLAPYDASNNYLTLAAGEAIQIPPGNWMVGVGAVSCIQYTDPVTGIWRSDPASWSARDQVRAVTSDGINFRVANLTGCAVASVVTGNGSAYVQASTTVTSSAGGSTWQPIVGGMLATLSLVSVGANYGIEPLVFIPAPPSPGVQATAKATVANGTVASVTITNQGAGYPSGTAPIAQILPSPFDPNLSSGITQATVTLSVIGAGSIAAVLCTNPGTTTTTAPTLSVASSVGSGATVSALRLTTLTGGSVPTAGGGYTGGASLITVGGTPTAGTNTNPLIEMRNFLPRPAQVAFAAAAGCLTSVSAIYDGGLFLGTPQLAVLSLNGIVSTTTASVTATFGAAIDTILLQPLK